MRKTLKPFLYLFLLTGFLAAGQQKTKPTRPKTPTVTPAAAQPVSRLPKISAKGGILTVTDKGKTYTFNFLMPKTIAVSSRFVKVQKEFFYIRYDYTASARAQSYYMVGYRYYNGKIYLRRFANLKNRGGKWSGTTHFYADKQVNNWAKIQELLTTLGAEDVNDNKNVGIYQERKPKGKMALINGIKGDVLLQRDDQFIGLLNAAMTKAGL
jgi:hypothetical protein